MGQAVVDIDEDVELRKQADHAYQLCRLPKDIRDIIDGYAAGIYISNIEWW